MIKDNATINEYTCFRDIIYSVIWNIKRFEIDDKNIFIYYDCDIIEHSIKLLNSLIMQYDFKIYSINSDTIILQDRYNYKIKVYFESYSGLYDDEYTIFNKLLQELAYCLQGKLEQEKRK